MSNIQWGKFAIWTGVILTGGYSIMRWSVPTEDQFYDSLSPELKKKMDQVRAQRAGNQAVKQQLDDATQNDTVIWAEQQQPTKPVGARR